MGLDLGTKTCGVCLTDTTNTMVFPKCTIRFKKEDYNVVVDEVEKIVKEEGITNIVVGLPVNMDGTKGFAAERTMNFIKLLERIENVEIDTYDERLTSMQAEKNLHNCDLKSKEFKDKVDMEAACLILEAYLRRMIYGDE